MNWYCLHTRPQRENHVSGQLSTFLGLETYLPTIRLHKTIRRVRKQVVEPLFPRYVFCRFNSGTHYRAVRYTRDVLDVVSFGNEAIPVSDQLVSEIRSWVEDHARGNCTPAFAPGDRVEITFGPMQGLHAVILNAHDDRERVAVLLTMLGNETRVTIDRDCLAKSA